MLTLRDDRRLVIAFQDARNNIQQSEHITLQCVKHIGQEIEFTEAQGLHPIYLIQDPAGRVTKLRRDGRLAEAE
jgi:hypothetical protein